MTKMNGRRREDEKLENEQEEKKEEDEKEKVFKNYRIWIKIYIRWKYSQNFKGTKMKNKW